MSTNNTTTILPFMDSRIVDMILTNFWWNNSDYETNVGNTGAFTVIFAKENGELRTMHCWALGIGPGYDTVIDPLWNGPNNCVVTDRDCDEVRCFSMHRVLSICDTSKYFAQMNNQSYNYNIEHV